MNELDDNVDYRISGGFINNLHDTAVRNFNESQIDDTGFSYAQAFWNGYGSALRGLRDSVANHPLPDWEYGKPEAPGTEVP